MPTETLGKKNWKKENERNQRTIEQKENRKINMPHTDLIVEKLLAILCLKTKWFWIDAENKNSFFFFIGWSRDDKMNEIREKFIDIIPDEWKSEFILKTKTKQ